MMVLLTHPKRAVLLLVSLGGAWFPAGDVCARGTQQTPPHVVLILVDDLGWGDLGCYGSTFYETPNVDRLAASGTRFIAGYAAHPVCSPTRAAIMTGKNPARLGITDWIPGQNPPDRPLLGPDDLHQLPLGEVTIAERLRRAGYATFFAGKWHLGGEGFFPEDQGFDTNHGGHEKGSPPGGYYTPYKNPKLDDGPEGEYLTDRLTGETITFIEEHSRAHPEQPFFVDLSFYTVHTPIEPCRRHLERYRAKARRLEELEGDGHSAERDAWTKDRQDNPAYASMVHAMDENVGRLLAALERLALEERTVVIFTSDNGGLSTLPRRGAPTSNRPLRAGKGWCYEGGIRVPFIIRAPGVGKPGSTSAVPVESADLHPTILELAGLPFAPREHPDGETLVPILRGGDALRREAIVWHYPHYHGSAWRPGSAIRRGDWKLIELYEERRIELYNLADDPGEAHDLAAKEPERTKMLRDALHAYLEEVGAAMPRPNPEHESSSDRRP